MDVTVLTLFPEMVDQGLDSSILGRAREAGLLTLHSVNIRDYTKERHQKVDDYPYGGGAGMLMQAQPVYDAYMAVTGGRKVRTIYVTPQGSTFNQTMAGELAEEEELVFLCGHYEGIDERVLEEIVTDYVSIGDYVLTGGELAAMVMIDAIARLVPGVLHNGTSAQMETFHNDLLEYPQYSRPPVWRGKPVPEVLFSGNHKDIDAWRLAQAEERTQKNRPDLYARYQKKQKAIACLGKHKWEHIHMMESLREGRGELLYDKEDTILVYDRMAESLLLTASSQETALKLVRAVEREAARQGRKLTSLVVCQEYLLPLLAEHMKTGTVLRCRQACFTRKEPLPVPYKEIRLLQEIEMSLLEEISESPEGFFYGAGSNKAEEIYGAWLEEKLVGVIALLSDGGMGMLFVREEYRRRGIGSSLEAFLINRLRSFGKTPYCHIPAEKEAAIALQEKLGLILSGDTIWRLTVE